MKAIPLIVMLVVATGSAKYYGREIYNPKTSDSTAAPIIQRPPAYYCPGYPVGTEWRDPAGACSYRFFRCVSRQHIRPQEFHCAYGLFYNPAKAICMPFNQVPECYDSSDMGKNCLLNCYRVARSYPPCKMMCTSDSVKRQCRRSSKRCERKIRKELRKLDY